MSNEDDGVDASEFFARAAAEREVEVECDDRHSHERQGCDVRDEGQG